VPLVQVPWVQAFEAQQGWLSPPHAAQLPDWQRLPAWHWVPLVQHACPVAPHAVQVPDWQRFPAWHWVPLVQHACPVAPQAWAVRQLPLWQVLPASQVEPSQQAKPLTPQQ
jgi:hypothetical protein